MRHGVVVALVRVYISINVGGWSGEGSINNGVIIGSLKNEIGYANNGSKAIRRPITIVTTFGGRAVACSIVGSRVGRGSVINGGNLVLTFIALWFVFENAVLVLAACRGRR